MGWWNETGIGNTLSSFVTHNLSKRLPDEHRGAVIAIGNFDGVHKGHQFVLNKARAHADELGVKCFALSFEPHPRTLFKPESPVFRLTPESMKARVLEAAGLDGLLILPFTRELASTQAEDFVDRYLLAAAGVGHIMCGFNFHFGKDRVGSPEFLKASGDARGFGVTIIEAHADAESGEPVSSSRIRRCLGGEDAAGAAELLGYRWLVSGEVVKGAQLGRTLGYPTANLVLEDNVRLSHGIYAVRLRRANGDLHDGVASYGRRPTFDNGAPWLETFIFDFDQDIYGEQIEVSLFEYLRGEVKFDSAEALVEQMDKDAEQAKEILKAAKPLSKLDAKLNFGAGA